MDYIYAAEFQADPDDGYIVTFPDVPEAITQGDNLADARASAVDALGMALRGYLAKGLPLPAPAASGKGLHAIPVDARTALKLAVIEAFNAAGISKVEFARRLGKPETEPYRILDPDHPTKLPLLETALTALGKEIVISVRNAA
ncbi:type II toxin-antitoxin system HicB family antitoxin [Chelativorans xinjiangense]|uniref:type II toxin-antitoxin system HicB family antitoxin n=1 Tax=Chelativorans xinjiangense TaxID=2681485 RepID=UPI0013583B6D|nr:type II toxin-antitoxin system HicB family antitoxin [Chelativorans xinjiangense]